MGDEQKINQDEIIARLGTFFIILGLFFTIMFVASDNYSQPNFDFLFLGMAGLGFGFFFRRRAAPPPSSGRFGWIRTMREKLRTRKEEKKKKKAEKK